LTQPHPWCSPRFHSFRILPLRVCLSVFLFSFCGEFSPLGDKKKGLANLTKGIIFFKSPYLEEEKTRSRQI
jgi:hypothetical protein